MCYSIIWYDACSVKRAVWTVTGMQCPAQMRSTTSLAADNHTDASHSCLLPPFDWLQDLLGKRTLTNMLKARAAATGRSAVSSLPPLLKRSNGRVPRTLPSAQQQQHLRHQRHQHGLLRSTTVAHASNKVGGRLAFEPPATQRMLRCSRRVA
jgi:hypothetical protein